MAPQMYNYTTVYNTATAEHDCLCADLPSSDDGSCALDVVIEAEVLVAELVQDVKGLSGLEVLELDQAVGEAVVGRFAELCYHLHVLLPRQPLLFAALQVPGSDLSLNLSKALQTPASNLNLTIKVKVGPHVPLELLLTQTPSWSALLCSALGILPSVPFLLVWAAYQECKMVQETSHTCIQCAAFKATRLGCEASGGTCHSQGTQQQCKPELNRHKAYG